MLKTGFWTIGMLLAGCALNDQGFVKVRYFENESSYMLTQESWGCYLSTRQADGGLTLGHAKRILIYPKPGAKTGVSVDAILREPANLSFNKEIAADHVDLQGAQPYAWIEKNQGVMLHANALKTGFSAGLESRSVIRLPADFDGVLMFGYRGDGTVEAALQATSQTKQGETHDYRGN